MKNIRIMARWIHRSSTRGSWSEAEGAGRNPARTSPLRGLGTPSVVTRRKPKNARMATLTMIAVVTRLSAAASGIVTFPPRPSVVIDAASMLRDRSRTERPLFFLAGRVRAARRSGDPERRVHRHRVAGDRYPEPVEAARRRPKLVLAGLVVFGAVAWALEPLRLHAERNLAPKVHTPLVERHH